MTYPGTQRPVGVPDPRYWERRNIERLLVFLGADLAEHLADDLPELCRTHNAVNRGGWRKGNNLLDQDYAPLWDFILQNSKRDRGEATLFGKPTSPILVERLRWVKGLRHKYAHGSIDGPEQLGDLLLLRQLVKSLRNQHEVRSECLAALEDAIAEELPLLFSRVAESLKLTLPNAELEGPVLDANITDPLLMPKLVVLMERLNLRLGQPSATEPAEVRPLESTEPLVQALKELRAAVGGTTSQLDHLAKFVLDLSQHQLSVGELVRHMGPVQPTLPGVEDDVGDDASVDWLFDATEGDGGPREGEAQHAQLSEEEARDQLIALRWRIWEELGVGASPDGLLRKRMIDHFIRHRVSSNDVWLNVMPEADRLRTDPCQLRYLADAFAIVSRLA